MRRGPGITDVLGRNSVHPFPARMAPTVALQVMRRLPANSTVLDPMAGSGTVLALARSLGHRAIGFDVDPLAVLMSRVWTSTIDPVDIKKSGISVLKAAKRIAATLPDRDSYPGGADEETRKFIRYWFDPYARRQLAALAIAIGRVRSKRSQEVLFCAFSRLIISKQAGASLAMDLAHSRPHRKFARAPRKPFQYFMTAVERVIESCVSKRSEKKGPRPTIRLGDTRQLPVTSRSVDLVFTSPPYLNAIDYLRCSKFSLIWMGYSIGQLRIIRQRSIGAEVKAHSSTTHEESIQSLRLRPPLPSRMKEILRRYADDTSLLLREISRVLTPAGTAVLVMGENTVGSTYVRTARLITVLGREAGLQLTKRRIRKLPAHRRYLPPPSGGAKRLDSRMGREVVLTFKLRPRLRKLRPN
jgi:hypothetical protein